MHLWWLWLWLNNGVLPVTEMMWSCVTNMKQEGGVSVSLRWTLVRNVQIEPEQKLNTLKMLVRLETRLQFANAHRDKDLNVWGRVLWSDQTLRTSSLGCSPAGGTGDLKIDGITEISRHQPWQRPSAYCRLVIEWLKENKELVLEWTWQSPGLSPAENMWAEEKGESKKTGNACERLKKTINLAKLKV